MVSVSVAKGSRASSLLRMGNGLVAALFIEICLRLADFGLQERLNPIHLPPAFPSERAASCLDAPIVRHLQVYPKSGVDLPRVGDQDAPGRWQGCRLRGTCILRAQCCGTSSELLWCSCTCPRHGCSASHRRSRFTSCSARRPSPSPRLCHMGRRRRSWHRISSSRACAS